MLHDHRERIDDLLRRAGMSGVSPVQALVALGIALVCIAWCAWRFWPRSPEVEFAAAPAVAASSSAAEDAADGGGGGSGSADTTTAVVVHVVGAVARPGVYSLPAGSRVADAIEAAGGALGSGAMDALNLARLLGDGEQIALPTADEWEAFKKTGVVPGGPAGSGTAAGALGAAGVGGIEGAGGGKVNLNTADESALDALPGVGPATARRIIEDRQANGPFAKPEDLMRVSGIGEKKYDALKDLVTAQ